MRNSSALALEMMLVSITGYSVEYNSTLHTCSVFDKFPPHRRKIFEKQNGRQELCTLLLDYLLKKNCLSQIQAYKTFYDVLFHKIKPNCKLVLSSPLYSVELGKYIALVWETPFL